MTTDERITALAQSIYLARHNQNNEVDGTDLLDFQDQTISWINQLIPEIEKKADWNFVRTNDDIVGVVTDETVVSYPLGIGVRKLVVNPHRDLTIRQDSTIVSAFRLVDPNLQGDPSDYDYRNRATVLRRKVIFSRSLNDTELSGTIVADTISFIPQLSHTSSLLLDILDEYPDIRQLFVFGVVKNQLPGDIVQGGLTPTFSQKYAEYLQDCILENDASADTADAEREDISWVSGVGW